MKHMITEYNQTNEILYFEVDLGVYLPQINQVEEVLVLDSCRYHELPLDKQQDNTEVCVQSDDDSSSDEGSRIFEGFRDFVAKFMSCWEEDTNGRDIITKLVLHP